MNGHDEETYERKDEPTAFISREEHERMLKEERNKVLNEAQEEFKDYGYAKWSTKEVVIVLETLKLTNQPNDSTQ